MSTTKSALSLLETSPNALPLGVSDISDLATDLSATENGQRALLNILEDFATEKSSLEGGQRAMLNILDDFDAERARMEGAQRAVLNILDDSVAEKTHLEAAQRSMLNILDDFSEEKARLEETQRAVLNILDDFESEKSKVALANEQLEREVAERKRVEAQIRLSEERYRLLFESSPHPVWVYDIESLAILDVNQAAMNNYGYSRDEFRRLSIKDIRPSEDVPRLLQSVARESTGVEASGIWRHRKKDGTIIYVEIVSHALLYAGREARLVVATDITQRKLAEDALRANEERFRSVAETANDAIISADSNGMIVYFNRAAERIFGYSALEICGEPLTRLMPDRFHEAHTHGYHRYLATSEPRVIGKTVELVGKRKDNSEFPIQVSLAAWKTTEGTFFTSILSDISERKEVEKALEHQRNELAQFNAELAAANKELEAFSYSVSHDLRAPLRGIDGFSLALLEDYADRLDEDGKDHLQRVRAATQRMGILIDDLLNLSRVTRTEMRLDTADLSIIARSVAAELQKAEPERRVEFRIEEGLQAFVDSHLIRITLENLLGNAWKFTSKRKSACIEFGKTHSDGKRPYYVRDNGAGFDPTYADRLFGAFQRLHDKNDFPGTGVGLATVQRIIHRHGGHIWAESAVEKGATFYFTLAETEHRGD